MKKTMMIAVFLVAGNAYGATAIFGGYLTVDGAKYKSSSTYGGSEGTFDGHNFGTFTASLDDLVLAQAEILTSQSDGHSTFDFAFAYRVRLSSVAKSIDPGDYTFLDLGHGVDLGGGNEKGEITGQSINLMDSLPSGVYSIDVVHKVGAWEGSGNFERLASISNSNPGDTSWGSVNAYSATFTVTAVPEPSSTALLGLGGLALIFRRRK